MLSGIADGDNYVRLQRFYFAPPRRHACDKPTGLEMLRKVLAAEPPGTDAWYLLQSLRGFACFHLHHDARLEGITAYRALFAQALRSKRVPERTSEFFRDLGACLLSDMQLPPVYSAHPEEAASAFLMGYECWLRLDTLDPIEVPVRKVALAIEVGVLAIERLNYRYVEDVSRADCYALLKRMAIGAETYGMLECPLRLMKRAEKVLPVDDPEEVQRFYRRYAKLYMDLGRGGYKKAVELTLRRIAKCGSGYADLARLHLAASQEGAYAARHHLAAGQAAYAEVMAVLRSPQAPEADVLQAANDLRAGASGDSRKRRTNLERAVGILLPYLTGERARTPDAEVEARLAAGQMLRALGREDEALKVLREARPDTDALSGEGRMAYRRILELAGKLRATEKRGEQK
jgi:hypothetical protein